MQAPGLPHLVKAGALLAKALEDGLFLCQMPLHKAGLQRLESPAVAIFKGHRGDHGNPGRCACFVQI